MSVDDLQELTGVVLTSLVEDPEVASIKTLAAEAAAALSISSSAAPVAAAAASEQESVSGPSGSQAVVSVRPNPVVGLMVDEGKGESEFGTGKTAEHEPEDLPVAGDAAEQATNAPGVQLESKIPWFGPGAQKRRMLRPLPFPRPPAKKMPPA